MSYEAIRNYINHKSVNGYSLGEMFGTENFALFLNSLLRMQRPWVVVELGTGAAVTALMAAEALQHNQQGHIWTVDDGSHWDVGNMRVCCQGALDYEDENETHANFINRLINQHDLAKYITLVTFSMQDDQFFCPDSKKIDILFADATSSSAKGCANILRYYLPKMEDYSSIFIDRASTIHHSLLFLENVVEQLNRGRIPMDLLTGLGEEDRSKMRQLVDRSSFSIMHLTETRAARASNPKQNSRAWIRIEPNDYLHHNDVITYGF